MDTTPNFSIEPRAPNVTLSPIKLLGTQALVPKVERAPRSQHNVVVCHIGEAGSEEACDEA